jgi:hypothetical protein
VGRVVKGRGERRKGGKVGSTPKAKINAFPTILLNKKAYLDKVQRQN